MNSQRQNPLGIPRPAFPNTWKRWPLLETSVFMQPPESAAPQGQRRVRLHCNFGFRDKRSLLSSGGTELLPAIKALKSNSSFPREHNLWPLAIRAALVAVVLPEQPAHGSARAARSRPVSLCGTGAAGGASVQ